MTQLIISNFDDALFDRLQSRATTHGRTAAEEAQALLTRALAQPADTPIKLGSAIQALFAPLGGVNLALPTRDSQRGPPDFTESDR